MMMMMVMMMKTFHCHTHSDDIYEGNDNNDKNVLIIFGRIKSIFIFYNPLRQRLFHIHVSRLHESIIIIIIVVYIQQLCKNTECSPEDLPEAINDWEKW